MSEDVTTHASDEFNPLTRELCPEGTCIGLIGPEGFCKECGRPGRGPGVDPRTQGLRTDDELASEVAGALAGARIESDTAGASSERDALAARIASDATAAPEDFAERRLCPEGTCIGVIGSDGVCGECGRLAGPA
jgi:hypothetical protein